MERFKSLCTFRNIDDEDTNPKYNNQPNCIPVDGIRSFAEWGLEMRCWDK